MEAHNDTFLQTLSDSIHDSAQQQKYRRLRPWPVGSVFIQHPDWDEEACRQQFRTMRELGFTALKQCQVCRGTSKRRIMHIALDEGIIPWWFGEAAWEDPTPDLLQELGIAADISMAELREHPLWLERQTARLHEFIDAETTPEGYAIVDIERAKHGNALPPGFTKGPTWVPSVQPSFHYEINTDEEPLFLSWLQDAYGDIDTLNHAWNLHHCMSEAPKGVPKMGGEGVPVGWTSWEHLAGELAATVNHQCREYRRCRDVLRFKADNYLNWLRNRCQVKQDRYPELPQFGGGEMGLFLPFASRGVDMEGIAEVLKDYGSMFPSFHLAWHFEEVDFETLRPYYMQASLTVDWNRGGWNATWESTGGPQQMTGGKAPFVPEVRGETPGFTVDEGVMRQLMLTWIAAGYRGFGLWAWCMRTFGWEGGEYGLVDRNYRPTDRAIIAGKIGQTCRRLRDELWTGRKEPLVGVFQDFDMEAIWAAAALRGRDHWKNQPVNARIGACRALINGNIPWEYVTAKQLRHGLAQRFKVLVLPAALALDEELLRLLTDYVKEGGRLVLDAPGGWFDQNGRVLHTDDESPFEQLFGCRLADFQYSRTGNRPWSIGGRMVTGCTIDLQPTTAEVLREFDHSSSEQPRPAVTEHRLGKGTAVVLACEASLMCKQPGDEAAEAFLRQFLLGSHQAPFACDGALVYRLVTDTADHYFLMNDQSEAVRVHLDTKAWQYSYAEDPVEQLPLELGGAIEIPACSARWIRMTR